MFVIRLFFTYLVQSRVEWACLHGVRTVKSKFSRVMGNVFFSPQGEGHGVAVYDSLNLEAVE